MKARSSAELIETRLQQKKALGLYMAGAKRNTQKKELNKHEE